MGICSKAREVICCNKMTDVPILQDIVNENLVNTKSRYPYNNFRNNNEKRIYNNSKEKKKKL